MPELPEVETVVRTLRPQIVGRRLANCTHASRLMAYADQGRFAKGINDRTVIRIDRQGKWIFIRLDNGRSLTVHLGMTGRLSVHPTDEPVLPHTHLIVRLDTGNNELRFQDPRRFGELLLLSPHSLVERFGPGQLGPDAVNLSPHEFDQAVRSTRRRIKAVLLDQRAIAGIGNIYADEILFDARLHPGRLAATLSTTQKDLLHASIIRVLKRAILLGGSSIRDYVDATGKKGSFQKEHRVYGRTGKPCRNLCGKLVQLDRAIVTGRATHFCPGCQPAPKRRASVTASH